MFCTIISYSGHKRGKKVNNAEKWFEPYYCVGFRYIIVPDHKVSRRITCLSSAGVTAAYVRC